MATKKKTEVSNSKAVGLGIGLTAAIAAAAGTFFLYGSKNASKNRKAVKSWTLKAKAEVLEGLEQAKEMSQEEYEELINAVSGAYKGAKNATKGDIVEFQKEMKDHWNKISKIAPMKKAKKVVSEVKKPVAKTVKKAVKKASKVVKQATE